MNIYELIGRLLLLHQECEDIFASCGDMLDKIIQWTKTSEGKYDPSSRLLDISIKLKELDIYLEEYNKLVVDNCAEHTLNTDG